MSLRVHDLHGCTLFICIFYVNVITYVQSNALSNRVGLTLETPINIGNNSPTWTGGALILFLSQTRIGIIETDNGLAQGAVVSCAMCTSVTGAKPCWISTIMNAVMELDLPWHFMLYLLNHWMTRENALRHRYVRNAVSTEIFCRLSRHVTQQYRYHKAVGQIYSRNMFSELLPVRKSEDRLASRATSLESIYQKRTHKWLIHGPKQRADNQSQSLKQSCTIS